MTDSYDGGGRLDETGAATGSTNLYAETYTLDADGKPLTDTPSSAASGFTSTLDVSDTPTDVNDQPTGYGLSGSPIAIQYDAAGPVNELSLIHIFPVSVVEVPGAVAERVGRLDEVAVAVVGVRSRVRHPPGWLVRADVAGDSGVLAGLADLIAIGVVAVGDVYKRQLWANRGRGWYTARPFASPRPSKSVGTTRCLHV